MKIIFQRQAFWRSLGFRDVADLRATSIDVVASEERLLNLFMHDMVAKGVYRGDPNSFDVSFREHSFDGNYSNVTPVCDSFSGAAPLVTATLVELAFYRRNEWLVER